MNDDKAVMKGGEVDNSEIAKLHSPQGVCVFNVEKYREDVEEFDLTEDQATELLQTLWNIMATFVGLGFGVDSVQLLLNATVPENADSVSEPVRAKSTANVLNGAKSNHNMKGTT
ncbi:hypothetical protein ACPA2M_07995 [Ectopseudomonas chengduensis]